MPLVTVVVPLFNKERFVRRALDSIAAQTFTDFEALIVDDGSTDGSAAIAAGYPDARFRLIQQTNSGPGAARNRGIEEAAGDLVAFLDADDEWLSGYLEAAVAALRADAAAAAITCGFIEYPKGVSLEAMWRRRGLREGPVRVAPDTPPARFTDMLAYMSPCTTVARRSVLNRWGNFYTSQCRFGEDAFLWLKVLLNEKVRFDLEARVAVHREAAQLSKNLTGARPLEPFLEHPELIVAACPAELRGLLSQFLSLRAFKSSCVWGYWGEWRQARALRTCFRTRHDWRLPYYWSSLLCSTPIGSALGWIWRRALV